MGGTRRFSRSRSRSPARGGNRHRDREDRRGSGRNNRHFGGRGMRNAGLSNSQAFYAGGDNSRKHGHKFGRGYGDAGDNRPGRAVVSEEEERERMMSGPMMNFKQFVMTRPDHCTQKQLSQDYENYVEQYREYHAKLFFSNHSKNAFMRELYHPNLVRRQFELLKARAKNVARVFVEKVHRGFFSSLSLDADSPGLRQFIEDSAEGSPLLWNEWPSQQTVDVEPSLSFEMEEENGQDEEMDDEEGKPKRRLRRTEHPQPPFLLLPTTGCLMIRDVDPAISKFDIHDELAKKGAIYVGMAEGGSPVEARTAFVLFPDEDTKQVAMESIPDMTIKVTKPMITITQSGDEQETLKVISLTLSEPPQPPTCDVSVAPPAVCTPSRIQKDLDISRSLISNLDEQLGVWDGMETNLFLASLSGDMNEKQRLDLQITYLRQVHSLCYYSGELCKDAVELNTRCGGAFLRPQIPASLQHYVQNAPGEDEGDSEEEEASEATNGTKSGKQGSAGQGGIRARGVNSTENDSDAPQTLDHDQSLEDGVGTLEEAGKETSQYMSRSQRRWLTQLDARLEGLLNTTKQLAALLPAAIDEDTPVINMKWTAFCHEKVFEDDEHKHRCRLCNKPFKAPIFVFKHLRKKHEEELDLIIDKYASILMKDLYMKDPNKPIVLPRESSRNSMGDEGGAYARGSDLSLPWPPGSVPNSTVASSAGAVHAGYSVVSPYGMVVVPAPLTGGALYAVPAARGAAHSGGVMMPPPPPPQYYAAGGGPMAGGLVYGNPGSLNNRRPDWDAPEPIPAPAFGAQGKTGGSRALASYDDL
ncbi:hypothetical protein TGME49_293630 [Toxoplasma gondii ME49]|uniref:Arsenite-resistance protein 2 n=17 Tax=Toxoplasma gondii TaxID=5811 RepID=A0A125YPX7_TOXGV|nr:hypothetical protein TGME49_293630 [Toxoplasma gondii ME49]EPR57620.1 hypothetical protein TGGT1_293630 [Toxoplasma gondii GT1]ESS29259.1 arsenite-resistance protein 2 [Toxoplasma gondii VEG]KAF4646106.1 hypothetical protein TGRH88_018930 [Toxoplasma gondii]KFG31883.1 arsenite-resistance protein 2 [Toxoplasma gondii GAB2-2007-GAL-DOM2]KFG35680.1 arsenite-resistance protein 2 [Toxoplasma gondii p89]KFH03272.1 arsenite-resistance protein 2 [Toxoplasma gondii VAND]KFH14352.1 arsenite-resista|eukprot:XP_018638615.1 hypothetical protein TGME49_293630 [Toxoplasma gondii ME49]